MKIEQTGTHAVIVIPAFEPTENFITVMMAIREVSRRPVVVVDDGSGIHFQTIFGQVAELGDVVLTHETNRGKGAALKTAIGYVQQHFPNSVGMVTADSDGQHAIDDIVHMAEVLEAGEQGLVLGVRNFEKGQVPAKSYWGNTITSKMTKLATGLTIPDTQTGLRGLPMAILPAMANVQGERFEYEMNMLLELKSLQIKLTMIPIQTIYEGQNEGTHFHPVRDSLLVYRRFLKFGLSSLTSAGVDVLLFALLLMTVFHNASTGTLLLASVLARLVSGVVNFSLNQRWVFRSQNVAGNRRRYLILFSVQMILSAVLLQLVDTVIPHPIPVKIMVDVIIFIGSYLIQKQLVFKQRQEQIHES